MHCSATADKKTGRSSLLFGLSGTGKTTLSADPHRLLIGDDEHCWTDDGIFNIEGGCYAKAIDLTPEAEPEIFQALRFGAVLENVVYDPAHASRRFSRHVDHGEHARRYPIEFIRNAKIPCVAGHPTDVIFLTCDAFGVLPPVSKLTPAQAMYHFISGYTAKVAGTEMGVTEPQATFSPCFGGPFLVWHPTKYAELLADKDAAAQGQRLAGEHRLERRRVWRRLADEAQAHAGDHRRDSQRRAGAGRNGATIPSSASPCRRRARACRARFCMPRNTWSDKAATTPRRGSWRGLFTRQFPEVCRWGERRSVRRRANRAPKQVPWVCPAKCRVKILSRYAAKHEQLRSDALAIWHAAVSAVAARTGWSRTTYGSKTNRCGSRMTICRSIKSAASWWSAPAGGRGNGGGVEAVPRRNGGARTSNWPAGSTCRKIVSDRCGIIAAAAATAGRRE